MRALAWPIYSYAGKPLADSGYICFRNLVRAIPEWTWHVVVPDWAVGDKALKDDLDDLPNVTKVPVPMPTLYRAQEVTLDPETLWRYSPQVGLQPMDVIVAGSNQIASVLMNAYTFRMQDHDRPFVVAWDLLTRDDRNRGWRSQDVELMLHFAGAAVVDLNVYGSPMMEWMTMGMLRKQFAPYVVRQVMERSETVFAGVPVTRIDEVTDGIAKRDEFTVFYGGRMGAVKRVDDLTEIADLTFQFGRDMRMVLCTGSLPQGKAETFRKQFPFVELHVGTSQEDAWRLMAECHAAIMWSKHEMIGSMFIEEMAHGLPLIASPHRWLTSLLPEEYPYWAENALQAGTHLRMLYEAWREDPDRYDEPMWPFTSLVRKKYDAAVASQEFRRVVEARVMPLIDSHMEAFRSGKRASLLELCDEVTVDVDEIGYADLLKRLKDGATLNTFVGAKIASARSNGSLDVHRAMLTLGWTDVGLEEPVYRRTK